ncbi:MAG TPA: GAP family protein [Actinomycetes bacterium]|nr:GAP family protein [Actinomycetes bacterium]
MLSEAIGSVLPVAVAVALSPIPIVAVVVLLGTPRARSNGAAFTLGWIAGLAVVMAVVLLLAGGTDSDSSDTTVSWGLLALGVLLLALAVRQWRTRPRRGEDPKLPAWLATVDAFTPAKSFVAGVLLSGVNPKNLALTIAAAGSIALADLDSAQELWAAVVFVAIASSSVIVLVAASLVAHDRMTRPLATVRAFMAEHNAAIMTVILLLLGVKLVGDALPGL